MLEALRRQVRQVIATTAPAIRVDLAGVLERPGFALHPEGPCRAGMLALQIHEAIVRAPAARTGLLAAAAVELQMEAAYVFDEVADAPPYARRSEDLALAIALLAAGGVAATEAASGAPDPPGTLRSFYLAYGGACAGQFLDAMLQRRGAATLEEALETTCLKSGGLGGFVAGFAARVAGAEAEEVGLLERLGTNTFTFGQLVDDLRDACGPGDASDLAQGKATLPVVFYRLGIDSESTVDGRLSANLHGAYEASGAPAYVAIVAQMYMKRARGDLRSLAQRGYAVEGLGRFLDGVESGAQEVLSLAAASLAAGRSDAGRHRDPARIPCDCHADGHRDPG